MFFLYTLHTLLFIGRHKEGVTAYSYNGENEVINKNKYMYIVKLQGRKNAIYNGTYIRLEPTNQKT